jgi:hypothetical protein
MRRFLKRVLSKHFPLFLMAYRYAKENQRIFDSPKETPMGFRFTGSTSMESGAFELDETGIAKKVLKYQTYLRSIRSDLAMTRIVDYQTLTPYRER